MGHGSQRGKPLCYTFVPMDISLNALSQEDLAPAARPGSKSRRRLAFWAGLTAVFCLAAFLRFYHLDGYGLWSDEFVTLMIVSADPYHQVLRLCFEIPQPMPPLYFLLEKAVFDHLIPGEISLRLLSALASLLTVLGVFAIGKRLANAEVAFTAAILCAINATQIVYAQNARPYALCLLLSALSMICFLDWLKGSSLKSWLGYLVSTALLVYTHYIFLILPLIQTVHLLLRPLIASDRGIDFIRRLRSWTLMQIALALLCSPLIWPLWRMVQSRQSLNWERRRPGFLDFLMFVDLRAMLGALGVMLLFMIGGWLITTRKKKQLRHRPIPGSPNSWTESFSLLFIWAFLPPFLFFLLFHLTGLNLFVERYLILSSLPIYLLLPLLALGYFNPLHGRAFLASYLILYVALVPAHYFIQKREFSPGVPGASEWRESLGELRQPEYATSLVIFQSPFIEANGLQYENYPLLFHYLSSPLNSFYLNSPPRRFVLLPHYWWIQNQAHFEFKAALRKRLDTEKEFVVFCTQEFWETFSPWLQQGGEGSPEFEVVREFKSCGALRLIKISAKLKTLDRS
ncbi:MAG: glycosyltransferase family 39 protein [Terriglobia bacterium]